MTAYALSSSKERERLPILRSPGDAELIIRTKTHDVPSNHILECLELRWILGSTDQFDARRHGLEITCSEVELELSTFICELGLHFVAEVADQLLDVTLRPRRDNEGGRRDRARGRQLACTRTGNFLIPLTKLLRTLVTSPFSSIDAIRGISSVNMSRISMRASELPRHACGLPFPKVR